MPSEDWQARPAWCFYRSLGDHEHLREKQLGRAMLDIVAKDLRIVHLEPAIIWVKAGHLEGVSIYELPVDIDGFTKPDDAHFFVRAGMSDAATLRTVAHEARHVYQYANGKAENHADSEADAEEYACWALNKWAHAVMLP